MDIQVTRAKLDYPPRLSQREYEILELTCIGLTNAKIAETLHVSLSTIKNQRSHLFDKLEAKSIAHAVAMAIGWGLINIRPKEL